MKVLRENSGLNLNPQQEGTRIYVPIPKVTREHREKLAKGAKQKCNETKDLLRKVQSKKSSKLGEIELEGNSESQDDLIFQDC
jgi:ribosome recycling factor